MWQLTFVANVVKPCIVESVRLVLGEEAWKKIKQISLSNKENVVSKIMLSPFFSLQLDESTNVANNSQLLVFSRYITDKGIKQEFLFCRPLETTMEAADVMKVVTDSFEETRLIWNKLEGVCTDGGPIMLSSR